MILITGATGNLGGSVLQFLLDKVPATELAALVRDADKAADLAEKGVDIRQGDYDDYTSLVSAFQGIDKLFFVSANDIEKRIPQHERVVKAAKESGVKHILYTSFQRNSDNLNSVMGPVAEAHLKTEGWIKESGIPYTILKNALYAEVLPMFLGEQVLDTGIFLPAGDGKVAYATRQDMAEASANVLTTSGHENQSYEFASDKAYTFHEIADTLSEIAGKKVPYISPDPETFETEMEKIGVPDAAIGMSLLFAGGMKEGEFNHPDTKLEELLGRKPVSVPVFLKSVYGA